MHSLCIASVVDFTLITFKLQNTSRRIYLSIEVKWIVAAATIDTFAATADHLL